jgi:hypothetical protein
MTIYCKTAKGMEEIIARRTSIDPRLNSALVLVDGKRSSRLISEALEQAGLPADAMEMLLHGGFIEVKKIVPVAAPASPPAQPTVKSVAPEKTADEAQIAQDYVATVVSPIDNEAAAKSKLARQAFQALYEFMVSTTKESLGLRGFPLQLRIERAVDILALTELVAPISESIAKRHGLQQANDFLRDVAPLIGSAKPVRSGLRLITDRRTPGNSTFYTGPSRRKSVANSRFY